MPVRITPNKSLLISYDAASDSWVSLEGVSLCLLPQFVEIEPGVTVENIFDLIERDPELKKFLCEYCSCNINEVRNAPSSDLSPIEIPSLPDDNPNEETPIKITYVDTVVVAPFFFVFTDHVGDRRLEGRYTLLGCSSAERDCRVSFPGNTYADIKDFPIVLDPELFVDECDADKLGDLEVMSAFTANIQYTLFDVLTTVVGNFGKLDFDPRYQKQVDEENAIWERLRRRRKGNDNGENVAGE